MPKPKLVVLILLAFLLLTAMSGINLALPPDTHAHPPYGFTPQPPPPPPPPPGGGGDDGDDNPPNDTGGGDRDHQPPSDYVIIQLERCNLSCAAGYPAAAATNDAALLAANQAAGPLLQNMASIVSAETLARVRLVHRGSGWIAEGVISDAGSTRFALPYPGLWDVFLMAEPQLTRADTASLAQLNLEQLHTQLANGPVSLGTVEANTAATQWVNCPLACIINPPPPVLPETGADRRNATALFIAGGLLFWLLGLSTYKFHHP
jgi:hypothetical protein